MKSKQIVLAVVIISALFVLIFGQSIVEMVLGKDVEKEVNKQVEKEIDDIVGAAAREHVRKTLLEPVVPTSDLSSLIVGNWKSKDGITEQYSSNGDYFTTIELSETFPLDLLEDLKGVASYNVAMKLSGNWLIKNRTLRVENIVVLSAEHKAPFQLISEEFVRLYGPEKLEEVRASSEKEMLVKLPKDIESKFEQGVESDILDLTKNTLKTKGELDGEEVLETMFRID